MVHNFFGGDEESASLGWGGVDPRGIYIFFRRFFRNVCHEKGVCLDLRSLYFREGLNLRRWLHIFWPFEPGSDGVASIRSQLCGWLGVWMDLESFWVKTRKMKLPKVWKKRCPLFFLSERFTINQCYPHFIDKNVTIFSWFDSWFIIMKVSRKKSWRIRLFIMPLGN